MKKIITLLLLTVNFTSFSQNCDSYYYFQKNKTVEMTITNKKGKESGKNIYTIADVNKSGTMVSSTINSELLDSKGKSIATAINNMKCVAGVIMMDMKMFIPSAQQEQMGTVAGGGEVYIEYPANMKEGDALKDASFSMDFKSKAGMNGSITIEMTNRKVESKESITTPAGTWNCFKITYHSKMNFKMLIGFNMNADVTEWYAPGFGVVKTESGGGGTEITAVK
jgi:hypothetical protein